MGIIFASDTPRELSVWLRLWIFFSNPVAVIGTAFLLIGGFFFFTFLIMQLSLSAAQLSVFPFWVNLLTLIFPLVGLLIVVSSFRKARKHIRLLKNGIYTVGQITKKERTNVTINKQRVYKIYFQFRAIDKVMYETFVKSHLFYKFGDERKEPLVYDPENPSEAILLDVLPKAARRLVTGETND